ncbi:hypothetical protein B5X24_HaOG202164 [Helicoverpa armigera]|uniref:Uncharacterized protein n=1 Tax=Helicoverpa armigera TaxID=29058 RepID=A0A2W1BZY3_HELAM|nr:hypothetical protein B5X24_HaOG202164 [Helicoverpa armigera]
MSKTHLHKRSRQEPSATKREFRQVTTWPVSGTQFGTLQRQTSKNEEYLWMMSSSCGGGISAADVAVSFHYGGLDMCKGDAVSRRSASPLADVETFGCMRPRWALRRSIADGAQTPNEQLDYNTQGIVLLLKSDSEVRQARVVR